MNNPDKLKRWRPQWSVRMLLMAISVISGSLACWEATRTQGVADLAGWNELTDGPVVRLGPGGNYFRTSAVAPLFVCQDEDFYNCAVRSYYFWAFGYSTKLPYEREVEVKREPVDFDYLVD